ncbi:putative tricarboxylic transport membrane protein [Tamaricihabitans halophyticus]|uniref:Putative tricarboxylic transport membrane protein n=1 Tax=Tamaricihabitans halophyticus TaxID=1262583 RepID=A0A4V2STA3_9PSEU|nr:tripartite tricarboxylate transporter permease [Tamaricihabitans halophyticus]TCP49986.1 putative tricarboxylic transport membrane protein [Tamaricihabitans halophyticus]
MDFLTPVLEGFGVALQPMNLLFCLIGVTLGMFVGVLPGLGPAASIAILLPITYNFDETAAIIMLAGIFYGALYGGTITAVLLRLPGEASSAVTALDGYAMARDGRAGTALGIAAISSFIGGTVAIIALTFIAPVVAGFALDFGPPEFTALALLGILMVATLGSGSAVKSVVAAALGLLLASIGQDPLIGTGRLNFGSDQLFDGIPFVIVAMGLFGVGEILYNMESVRNARAKIPDVGRVYPSRADLRQSRGAMSRGSVVGFVLGVLPGGGAVMSSMVSYAVEKRVSRKPRLFGKGAIQGVAGPETASNAAASSSMIPLLSLGIPANASMAVIFGALLLQGITPGPLLVEDRPDLFWGVVNSMYLGNILLVLMCLPLIGLFVRIVRIPVGVLAPVALIITLVGVYTVRMSVFDMFLMIALGVAGYLMKKTGFEPAPLVLAFILGGILESAFRRSMRTFDGQLTGFLGEPIAATLLAATVGLIVFTILKALRAKRAKHQPTNETTPV